MQKRDSGLVPLGQVQSPPEYGDQTRAYVSGHKRTKPDDKQSRGVLARTTCTRFRISMNDKRDG